MAEIPRKTERHEDMSLFSDEIITDLLLGMEQWADDEEGIHHEAWDAYVAGRAAIGYPVIMLDPDSLRELDASQVEDEREYTYESLDGILQQERLK